MFSFLLFAVMFVFRHTPNVYKNIVTLTRLSMHELNSHSNHF